MRRLALGLVLIAAVLACGPSPATPDSTSTSCTGPCASAWTTDGLFVLELALPRLDWKADEPISGTSTLTYRGPAPTNVYGSGSILNFAYAEVGGTRRVDPVWTADCATHAIGPATPISVELGKSGGVSDTDPNAPFLRSFLFSPDVRLPAGTWDVTALADFMQGGSCEGGAHAMKATVRLTVTD